MTNKNKQVAYDATRHNFPVLALDEQYTKQKIYHMTKDIEEEVPDTERSQPNFKFALREDLIDSKINFLPAKGEPYATGYDVRCALYEETMILKSGQYFKIPLGIRCLPPEGWWFNLHPRSSSFAKKNIHGLIGIIDEHYANELVFAGQYLPEVSTDILTISFGDAIGQIIPVKRIDISVESISNKEYDDLCKKRMAFRRGGFGSTG